MKVKKAEFVISAYSSDDYPVQNWPEFAFAGRSNVGKSSLINKLINKKNLARVSSQPGRTQSINFYNIDDRFFLVDLPGYGFAKVPIKVKEEWGKLLDDYLVNRSNLRGIIQIVDARHKPTKDDQVMVNWLKNTGFPFMLVATKVDKIAKGKRKKQEKLIKDTLSISHEDPFVFFSANTSEGKNVIDKFILDNF